MPITATLLTMASLLLPAIPAYAGKTSAASGNWSNPAIWSPAGVPLAVDSVTIRSGDTITVDITTAAASTTTVLGNLIFSRVANSSLTLTGGDLNVDAGGWLDMGNEASPVPSGVNAHLVLSLGSAAGQYGLIVNPGGNFTVRGSTKTPYSYATQSITTSDTSLTVYGSTSTAGWQVGDVITIAPTLGNGPATTSSRTISSITPVGSLYTVAWSGGALPEARVLTAASPIIVADLSRNVLVRSSGTFVDGAGGNSAYIRDLAQNATSFALAHGEFAYLGANLAGKYGITFDGALTRGVVSSATVRNGYRGMLLAESSNNILTANNVYSNSSDGISLQFAPGNILTANNSYSNLNYGIYLVGNRYVNTLTANNSYSNLSDGLSLANSSQNTLTANNCHSNAGYGINLFVSPDNTLTANNSYLNAGHGIVIGGISSNSTLIANNIYSNLGNGIFIDVTSNLTFADGNLGYDVAGNALPNTGSEVRCLPGYVCGLTLKSARVNPTSGVDVAGLDMAGNYMLSYNQDYSSGTVRLLGNYLLAGSTLTMDYALELYGSTTTSPKLMRGAGHSASIVTTNDANAVSQLVTLTYSASGANWRVEGSSSGLLGTFSGSIVNTAFPAGAPQFNLTFTQGASPQDGDIVDFALIAASQDQNVQKKLLFGPAASTFNGGRSKLTVAPTGGLVLTGTAANPTLVDMISGGTYYSLVSSGAFTMAYASMSNTDSAGLQLSGSNGVSISSSAFDFIGKNAGIASYITARDLTSNATFYNVAFNLSRSTSGLTAYNARTVGSDAGLWWNFSDATGPFSGAAYEYDPGGRIRWTETVPPGAIVDLSASTGTFSGTIALAWSAPGNNGATGTLNAGSEFRVQYTTDSAFSAWSPTAAQPAHVFRASISTSGVAPGSARGYQLGGLAPGATHYLRMFTADESGNWSAVSNAVVSSATVDSIAPGAVTDLAAAPGGAEGGITLTWTSPGNDGYVQAIGAGQFLIALSTNAADLTSAATSQAQIVIATAAAPGTLQSYTTGSLLLATSYYFRIWTRDEVPLYSSLSNGATAQARQFTPLPPSSFATSQIVGQITLTWAAPSTPPAPYLDHYELSYSTVAQTGPYTALASISSEVFTYAHTSLLNRTTYYYRALTADTGGLKSAPSENFAVTPDTVPPSAVTDLSAALGAGLNEIALQWTASGDDGMTGTLGGGSRYAIQYTTDAVGVVWNTANAQVVFSTSGVSPGAVQRRTLTGLTQSSTYYVRLWTGDPALNWSVASNISTATPRQPGPVVLSLLPAAGASGVSRTATVTVTFDKTVAYAALNGAFSLTLVRDASGNTVSVPAAGALSPASNASAFTFTPAASLAGNGVYMVSITTNALDVQDNPLQAAASAQFTTIMDRNAANSIVVAALGLTITVPAGALAADGYIQASTTVVSAAVTEANRKLISNSGDSSRAPVTGTVVDLTVYDALGAVQPGAFGAPVTVAMTYPDADGDGLVDGAAVPVRADTLGVWWLDEAASLWVRLPSSSADLQAKRVSAATSHFTTFALIGQAATGLADAYPYPVPFRPSKGHTKITFTGLGQTTRIRIFTVAGDKVADLTSNSIDGKYDWGVVNSAGQPVASGVYLYLLESGSNSKKGKLVVIR